MKFACPNTTNAATVIAVMLMVLCTSTGNIQLAEGRSIRQGTTASSSASSASTSTKLTRQLEEEESEGKVDFSLGDEDDKDDKAEEEEDKEDEEEDEEESEGNVSFDLNAPQYGQIISNDYEEPANSTTPLRGACIIVKDKNITADPILGSCDNDEVNEMNGWRMDGFGLLHTQLDDDYCMQAGRGAAAGDGNVVRLKPCDNSTDLQKFVFVLGSGIRPMVGNQSLCMVWKGDVPDIGVDPILMRNCTEVVHRLQWSGDIFSYY